MNDDVVVNVVVVYVFAIFVVDFLCLKYFERNVAS